MYQTHGDAMMIRKMRCVLSQCHVLEVWVPEMGNSHMHKDMNRAVLMVTGDRGGSTSK